VNLKFTKPELTVLINREKASMMGVNVQSIAQTLQLTMSEPTFFNLQVREIVAMPRNR